MSSCATNFVTPLVNFMQICTFINNDVLYESGEGCALLTMINGILQMCSNGALQFFVEHCYSYFVPRLREISFVKYSVLQSTSILGGTPKFSQI